MRNSKFLLVNLRTVLKKILWLISNFYIVDYHLCTAVPLCLKYISTLNRWVKLTHSHIKEKEVIYVPLEVCSKGKDIFSLCVAGSGTTTFSASLINLAPAADCTGDETLHLSPRKYSFCNRERFPSVRDSKPLLKGFKKSSEDLADIIEEYCNFAVLKYKLPKVVWFGLCCCWCCFGGLFLVFFSSSHFKPT